MTIVVFDLLNKKLYTDSRMTATLSGSGLWWYCFSKYTSFFDCYDDSFQKMWKSKTMDHITYAAAGNLKDVTSFIQWLNDEIDEKPKLDGTILQISNYDELYVNVWSHNGFHKRYTLDDTKLLYTGSGSDFFEKKWIEAPPEKRTIEDRHERLIDAIQYAIKKNRYCGGEISVYDV